MTPELPTAGTFLGREHALPVRVYYEDTDFTGLVYHASYVRFFERGRSDYLRLAGADHVAMAAVQTAFAVLSLNVVFKAAARIDDALTVHTTFASVKGPRILIAQRIARHGETLATAEVQAACIDLSGRARRPPPELIAALRPRLG
ncbi:MAG: YbgC/FadM family acyl-CoA thioesterase [Caulobacteraceae bacterium]